MLAVCPAAITVAILLAPTGAEAQRTIIRQQPGAMLSVMQSGPPPTSLRVGATPTSITLRWTCPAGATGYEVFATPAGGQQIKLTSTPIGPQCIQELLQTNPDPRFPQAQSYGSMYTHTGLAPGMQFIYVVRALYADAVGDAPALEAQTAPWPPPTGVRSALNDRSAILSWSTVPGATGYVVLRQLGGESALSQITPAPIAATTYADATILPPGEHRYSVQAVNGTAAAPITVQLGNWPAPAVTMAKLTHRRFDFHWAVIPGAPAYAVYRKSGAETSFRQVATRQATEHWYIEDNLAVGPHSYYAQVAGAGDPTAPVTVISGKPQAGARIYRGAPVVDLGWWGTDLALTTRVLRSPVAAGPYYDITDAPKSEHRAGFFRYRNAVVGITEYYKVAAFYPSGPMESDPIEVTIPTGPVGPTNLTAESPAKTDRYVSTGQASVWITWKCDPEATGYSVMRGPAGSGLAWITDSRGLPLVVNGCAFLDIFWPGNIPAYDYKVVGRYPDQDTSADAMITVPVH